MIPLSPKANSINIKPFLVMEILERAKQLQAQGRKILRMDVGEPDFNTPREVTEAAIEALKRGETRYSSTQGILPLREAIAEKYYNDYKVDISPSRIIVTSGSSAAMTLLFSLTLDAGDEVLLTDPYYACYPNFIRLYGAKPKYIPLNEKNGFKLYPEDIEKHITSKTKAIIINSPANPTGQLCPDELWEYLAGKNIIVYSDEIYHGLVYDGKRAKSVLEFTDNAFVINGFSKLYAMTGWRLGYIIAPQEWMALLKHGHENFFIAANTFVQFAGLAALEHTNSIVPDIVAAFEKRRPLLVSELNKHGIKTSYTPEGAFYLLVDFAHVCADSLKLAFDILDKTGVALAPGVDFGEQAKTYLRFSYATSSSNIIEAVGKVSEYLSNL